MKNLIWASLLGGMVFLLHITPTSAISLNFSPQLQTVQIGDSVSVDVVISGLTGAGEIVSAYDLSVTYNPLILGATGVTFGLFLDDLTFPGFSLQDSKMSIPGIINFAETSLLSDAELAFQQPDSFSLVILSFKALAAGESQLAFARDPIFGIDIKGENAQLITIDPGMGNVGVEQSINPVPEPGTLGLLLVGICTVSLWFWGCRRLHKSDT